MQQAIDGVIGLVVLLLLPVGALLGAFKVWSLLFGRHLRESEEEFDHDYFHLHCARCGYDLRASKERCPECGTSIAEMEEQRVRSQFNPHALRDNWPTTNIAVRKPAPDELPVQIYATENDLEARLIVEQLIARGAQAEIRIREHPAFSARSSVSRLHRQIVVSSGDAEAAHEILDKFRWQTSRADPETKADE